MTYTVLLKDKHSIRQNQLITVEADEFDYIPDRKAYIFYKTREGIRQFVSFQ